MAQSAFALPVAGLNPGHPTLTPGLALTDRQQRELAAALQQAPQPAQVLRRVREGLQQRQSIPGMMVLDHFGGNLGLNLVMIIPQGILFLHRKSRT